MKTRILHDGRHYSACALPDGSLVVERKRPGKRQLRGKRLVGQQAIAWRYHFADEQDSDIREAMCKAFLTD